MRCAFDLDSYSRKGRDSNWGLLKAMDRASDVSNPVCIPLRELLDASFEVASLRKEAEILEVEDLRALGSFASQPHPLIHRVVAAVTVMLLSLAPKHGDTGGDILHLRPWAVLRFELLTDPLTLWRRMHTRAYDLEKGDRCLAPIQIRFVCVELLQFLIEHRSKLQSKANNFHHDFEKVKHRNWRRERSGTVEQKFHIDENEEPAHSGSVGTGADFILNLGRLARVSTITAALGAWICQCLYFSCQRRKGAASPVKIQIAPLGRVQRDYCYGSSELECSLISESRSECDKKATIPSRSWSGWRRPQGSLDQRLRARKILKCPAVIPRKPAIVTSFRRALKIGGRFVLLRMRMEHDKQQISWSLTCLDRRLILRQIHATNQSPFQPERWAPFHMLTLDPCNHGNDVSTWKLCCLLNSTLPKHALESVLVQLAFRAGLCEAHSLRSSLLSIPLLEQTESSIVLQLHVLVVWTNPGKASHAQMTRQNINFVGLALIHQNTTMSALRNQLTFELLHLNSSKQKSRIGFDKFRFLYRGSPLPLSQEEHIPAASLLPLAVLVSISEIQNRDMVSTVVVQLERDVARQLRNCGTQNLILSNSKPPHVELVAVHEIILDQDSTIESQTPSVTEIFRNWWSFVQLQQLQQKSGTTIQVTPKIMKSPVKRPSFDDYIQMNFQKAIRHPEDIVPPLPRIKFDPKHEFLMPLYTTADVTSSSTLSLASFPSKKILLGSRLALYDEYHVVHVRSIQLNAKSTQEMIQHSLVDQSNTPALIDGCSIEVKFERDASCPIETLACFRGVYVWQILPRSTTRIASDDNLAAGLLKAEKWPPQWMCAIYHYVVHPLIEFREHEYFSRFRVQLSKRFIESELESAFWSKDVNWESYLHAEDVHENLLHQTYEHLCHSHPPSLAIDSVKFSKLLRECGVQPRFLSVGDAAFLFMSNLAPGSHYEMIFDGFLRALERVSCIMYPHHNSALKHFCFHRLVRAPSVLLIWKGIIEKWRRAEKLSRVNGFADKYCAATRIQARWRQVKTRRIHLSTLQRMKEERHAATRIQSVFRMHCNYRSFAYLKRRTVEVQLRIKARGRLRYLRKTRLEFIERMRVRLVRWMKKRLRVLRAWKQINARWVARRDRIWAKRQRLLSAAAYYLETRCYRFYLYTVEASYGDADIDHNLCYELEILDSNDSLCLSSIISATQVFEFKAHSSERQQHLIQSFSADRLLALQVQSQIDNPSINSGKLSSFPLQSKAELDHTKSHFAALGLRSRRPKPRPNSILTSVSGRIRIGKKPSDTRFYSNPVQTSLGKLVFYGAVRCNHDPDHEVSTCSSSYRVVKVLRNADAFTLIIFASTVATTTRFDVTATFILRVLQCMQFKGMHLPLPTFGGDICSGRPTSTTGEDLLVIHKILRGSSRLDALRKIITYVTEYQAVDPQSEMTPEVKAKRRQLEIESQQRLRAEAIARETEHIVKVQAYARQLLAKRARQRLAQARYRKRFDRSSNAFIYVLTAGQRSEEVRYKCKPWSLFDDDVKEPSDEWYAVMDGASNRVLHYVNDFRGVTSPFNEETASRVLQSWFRRLMWLAIKPWGLRELVAALQFHKQVEKPPAAIKLTVESDARDLENSKLYAMQLHTIHHDYKSALSFYENLVKITPRDPEVLVCLAVLLIASCRYPIKQTWARSQMLLQEVQNLLESTKGLPMDQAFSDLEDVCFGWALFLHPRDPEAIVNYAVFLQCVRHDLDKAELLYRRGLDYDPTNERIVENYKRLRSERAPGGLYESAGPGKVAIARATEVSRDGDWREMENASALVPAAHRFFLNILTGACHWTRPLAASPE